MNWRSTLLRFAALVFVLQVAAAAVLIGTVSFVLRKQVDRDVAASVEILRDDLLTTYAEGGARGLVAAIEMRTGRMVTPGAALLVVDPDGRRLAGNLQQWPASISPGAGLVEAELFRAGRSAPETMRVRATRLPSGERLITGMVTQSERRVLEVFEGASLLGLSFALAFAAFAAWISARWISARLEGTVATLAAVRDGDLAKRVADDRSGDAFAALGRAVNDTLERVETLVRELKIATDGLAHDLKSPLTRLRVALEQAAVRVREPEAQDAVVRAAQEGERLLSIVETALRITRAKAGVGKESFVPVDVGAELEELAEIFGPLAEETGRSIEVVHCPDIVLPAHRELLGQALANLIDNALKYGAGTIRLSAEVQGDVVAIGVADEGPGIPPGRRVEALRRFGRLDESRSGSGAGLGLALVGAVAQLHDGRVVLEDGDPGLVVRLFLGRVPPSAAARRPRFATAVKDG